jgi:ubiquinone/menaquinone biosynthesis C-methylase UbiE
MTAKGAQPDWDRIAEKFDLWLPQIAPVGDALLEALEARPGDRVVDLASGTGEPALTLARRMEGKVEIVGTDSAEGMIRVARAKAEKEKLRRISFECMPAERLTLPDASFDRGLCRFGVMLFEDSFKGLKELRRVLKPGARFALAVWGPPETMQSFNWSYRALKERLPEELHPPLAKMTSLGGSGVLEKMLGDAGFAGFTVETKSLQFEFESFEAYWDLVEASEVLKQQFDALPKRERLNVRDEVRWFAREFIRDGGLSVPHHYLLAAGSA